MISFRCPTCQTAYTVPDDVAGKKTSCRKCQQRLQIPAPAGSVPRKKTVLGELNESPPVDAAPDTPRWSARYKAAIVCWAIGTLFILGSGLIVYLAWRQSRGMDTGPHIAAIVIGVVLLATGGTIARIR